MLRMSDPYSVSDKAARRLAARLALRGATVIGNYAPHVIANWTPYCDEPVDIVRTVRPGNGRRALRVEMRVPCRGCERCLRFRRMRWRQRIINEMILTDNAARRTWFGTLTFAPTHLAGVLLEAKTRVKSGKPPQEAIEQAAYGHVSKYFKRLRKKVKLRFVAVPEYGDETQRLHYHVLIHEQDKPLLKRHLQEQWKWSFSNFKLVDMTDAKASGVASYVSKYISKGVGRPRASTNYGVPPSDAIGVRPQSRAIF